MIDIGSNWKVPAATLSAAVATGVLGAYAWKKYSDRKFIPTPKKWIRVGTVKDLMVYPIKSCKEVHVQEALPTILGLTASEFLRDRVFMVVNSRFVFQTQRVLPRMVLINATVRGDQVTLSAEGMASLTFTVPEKNIDLKRSCRIHDDRVAEAYDCGTEVGKWLDSFLEQDGFRLLYHASKKTQRPMVPLQKKFPYFVPIDKGTFQDQTSYLIIAEESVAELNTRLETPVSYRNFRPGILIDGLSEAFAEDFWTFLRIGGNNGPIFKTAVLCSRCKLTTVDPDTGIFNNNGEPLKSLTEMKREFGDDRYDELLKNLPVIGLRMGLFQEGSSIKVGDPVYAAAL